MRPMAEAVVVTGAAGALGRAVLAELRARGVETVVALDLPGKSLDQVGRSDGVHPIGVDLADRAAVQAAWERVDEIAEPHALVALAGGFAPGSLADLDEATMDTLWRSNVASLLWSCQAAAARMGRSGGGRSSLWGPRPRSAVPRRSPTRRRRRRSCGSRSFSPTSCGARGSASTPCCPR
jgi:NAD(P)-dependent dehydrogenase (short-subunit alcohol dehydrogenase family)